MKFTHIAQLAVLLNLTVLTFASYAQEPPEDPGVQQTMVPSDVDVVSLDLTGDGLTNGVGDLQVTASYTASLALGEEPSVVETLLSIADEELETDYFDTTYTFTIMQGQQCSWSLGSPTCNTTASGGYTALTFISGCNDWDDDDDFVLLFD
jgi:hypothetical protein